MADLPAKPSLDHLRRQARDLLRTALPGGPGWDDGRADRAWSGKHDDAARSPTSGTDRTPPPRRVRADAARRVMPAPATHAVPLLRGSSVRPFPRRLSERRLSRGTRRFPSRLVWR